ncbi:CusA/CzcA family heavy metal efflux RND transporter [Crocinitomicaceae bacterium CZZ-1]|uniref:CusA/CzcA family heavy metal efflux RND transporter n=1 Tax=Taishania pollutisoli TaxID=2766479 RepID=A0A8J6PQ75_9FLAO|nr:CusA/CzcA family heavy metal efflux RND transporter [Taishania pollutisoli]MBC9812828.1 CusA/CzcA family heavy metal efflux RND transporter [Taishania pollutisoli]
MLTKIIAFSIKNKLIVGLFTIFLLGYGIYELRHLPIDAVPDITDNQTQVITIAPSLGAPDVERLITFPIEQSTSNIPGLKELRSFSRFGLSIVTIVFDEKTDIYWARQQVSERLQQVQAQLPAGLGTPTLAPVTTGLGEVYQYTIRAKEGYEDKYDAMELRSIQDWIVRRQLIGVKGVAEVSSFGGLQKQYEVAVDPGKLMANNITIKDVFSALESNNQNTGGAYIEKGATALFIRSEGLVKTMGDIEQIVVKTLPDGVPLLIRDVAEIRFGHATRYGALTYNGEKQVSGAVVMMLKGANSNEVIQDIKDKIAKIQETLPEGVIIEPFLDRTKMVNNSISTVITNLVEGALIVIFVLVLFLGNFRAGFLVASVIPLSMLFAIIMMNLFGVSGNLMSLGALDFGLIVDGAVIIVEAVLHAFSHNKQFASMTNLTQQQMDHTVKNSASRMMNSAVFGQVIILIVYLPIFALQGIEGKMFQPMAQTVAFALIGAFILSLTYIPMMASVFLNKKISHKKTFSDKMMERIENAYQKGISKALNFSKAILFAVIGLFVISVFVLTRLGGEFIPDLPEGDFAVETRVLTGSSLTTSIEAVSKSSQILMNKFPEIERIVTKTGSSEIPTEPLPVDVSDMIIVLKDRKEWTSATTYEELERKMAKELESVPGVTFGFQFPVAMRFNELISGARQDVVCKIFGEDMDTLSHYAKQIGSICTTIDGVTGLYVEAVSGMPQIVINYKRAAVAQYGLNISDINRIVNSAFAGETSGSVFEGEKRFDLVVRLSGEKRKELEDVQQLLIPVPNGTQIPLNTVADVAIVDSPNQIQRENSQRRIIVGFNVDGRDVQSMVTELQSKIGQQVKLPPGYHISYGGAFKNLEAAKARLYIAVPVSLLLIFLLLYFAFRSVKRGLLIYSAIPLSAIGGILALAIRGIPFSISAGVGFIALFGVAVLNGIILIAEFKRLEKEGETDIRQLVIRGTTTRLRPVLMTACVASLGFLPMALSNGEGAEVQRPLATVVIGGLMVATFLTLFVLPILYTLFMKKQVKPNLPIGILLIGLFTSVQYATAQTPISLDAAIDTALQQNRMIKNERLLSEYRQKMIHSGSNLPQTSVVGEYGQINSIYSDVRLGVSQNLNFPTVYTSQKAVLREEWKSSVLNIGMKETELQKQVAQVYFNLAYLREKQVLLQQNDSLFTHFRDIALMRYDAGESNVLERATAENQQGQIRLQLVQLKQDIELMQLQFQLLLNTETMYIPESNEAVFNRIPSVSDTSSLEAHPALQYLKQQGQLAAATTRAEQAKLLPDITVGYNVMGMRGTGADNVSYDNNLRFQSVYFGLGIPLFFGGQKAKITASKVQETIAQSEYAMNKQLMENKYLSAVESYKKYQETINYFEETALHNARLMTETADQHYLNGNINYLEWVLLINQSISIQSDYIDALRNRNMAITEINSYITQ